MAKIWVLWEEILGAVGRLHWEEGMKPLPELAAAVLRLEQSVKATLEMVNMYKCSNATARRDISWFPVLMGAMVLDVVVIAGYLVWIKSKKQKVKIN